MPTMIGLMRLGRDAELRTTQSGESVASLSLAYNYGKPGSDGNKPTTWIDATLWGKRAETLAQYLTKGGLHCFFLDGLHLETFERKDGSSGTKLVAKVVDVELGSRQDAATYSPPRPAPEQPPSKPPAPTAAFGSFEDEIPF